MEEGKGPKQEVRDRKNGQEVRVIESSRVVWEKECEGDRGRYKQWKGNK